MYIQSAEAKLGILNYNKSLYEYMYKRVIQNVLSFTPILDSINISHFYIGLPHVEIK